MAKRTQRPRTLSIGSISSGTLRMADLIPSLSWELARLQLSRQERTTLRAIIARADAADEDSEYWQDGDAEEDYQDLCEIADSHVPDYCSFGSTEGDGAEIGVWPAIPDPYNDDDVFRVGDTYPTSRKAGAEGCTYVPRGYRYALHVNDHGNATLYRRAGSRWIDVWSVV